MMVRRHLLPPGKYQTFQAFDNDDRRETNQSNRVDTMARIIPKSHSTSSSRATATNTLATIHLSNNLKCPIKRVLLAGNLNEALASEMMPPPPPPPPLFAHQQPPPSIKTILNIAANNLLLPESEVEFYKSDQVDIKCGSVSSGGSANHDDFDDEETTNLGKTEFLLLCTSFS